MKESHAEWLAPQQCVESPNPAPDIRFLLDVETMTTASQMVNLLFVFRIVAKTEQVYGVLSR
jgi:hypothetical protein